MSEDTYKDPADKGKEHRDEKAIEEQEKSLDIEGLKFDAFRPVPQSSARVPAPFEGYPDRKVKIGTHVPQGKKRPVDVMINLSWIVGLNPTVDVFQDPSGLDVLVGDPRKNNEKRLNIPSSHNRTVSYNHRAFKAVFDRPFTDEEGRTVMICVIPDPIYRCQIIYYFDGERIKVDTRYLLPDMNQKGPLRRTFQMIINPRLKLEASIEQNFYGVSDDEAYKLSDMPGLPANVG